MTGTRKRPASDDASHEHRRDLRTTLVEAALAELERCGRPEGVTVAAILRAAGCTPPSLYHYWSTREQLLREAAALGWSRFESSQAGASDDPRPRDRIRRRGQAYLTFAREQPALFRVLFLGVPIPAPDQGHDGPDRGPAFWALHDDVSAAITAQEVDPGRLNAADLAMALWCAIHGLATFALADPAGVATHLVTVAMLDEAILGPLPGEPSHR